MLQYNQTKTKIAEHAIIIPGAIVVGDTHVSDLANIWFNATVRGDMASITIGKGTNIQDNAVIHTDTNLPTTIGEYVTIGHSAIVHAATVKDHALIGMGSVILNGAVIEARAMVAAGTIVPPGKVVPEGMLALGNPMRIVRPLTAEEIDANHKNALRYIELARSYHE